MLVMIVDRVHFPELKKLFHFMSNVSGALQLPLQHRKGPGVVAGEGDDSNTTSKGYLSYSHPPHK